MPYKQTEAFYAKRDREDAILIDMIKKYPTNIAYACQQAAVIVGISMKAMSGRYYQRIKKKDNQAIIATGSEKGLIINTKNTKLESNTSNEVRKALLVAVFNSVPLPDAIEFLLNNLTNVEQQTLLERMINKLKSA